MYIYIYTHIYFVFCSECLCCVFFVVASLFSAPYASGSLKFRCVVIMNMNMNVNINRIMSIIVINNITSISTIW